MNSISEKITSAGNPLVKRLRSLEQKKYRAETGCFIAEGARLVAQALEQGWQIKTLITGTREHLPAHLQTLIQRAEAQGARHAEVSDRLLGSISRKHNPQSVIAEIQQKSLDLSALPQEASRLWLGLYEVRDPGNLGTILRTVDCAGAAGIVLIGQCCDPYSVEAVRASMGSLFDVALAQTDFATFQIWRKSLGLQVIAASMQGQAPHTDMPFQQPSMILMGNEQSGLPPAVEAECDQLCRIPMRGGADSLNLAQASAIILYEAWRQREFR